MNLKIEPRSMWCSQCKKNTNGFSECHECHHIKDMDNKRVNELEKQGCTTSDAQAVIEAEEVRA